MSTIKKKLHDAFAEFRKENGVGLEAPPLPDEARGNTSVHEGKRRGRPKNEEETMQVNLHIRIGTRKKLKLLAARDGKSLSRLVEEAIDLYEQKHGAAPQ